MRAAPIALGEFEQMVLLAVLCVEQQNEDAYGVTVHAELETRTDRQSTRAAVYMTLDRLEKKGLLRSTLSEPMAVRGGRARRCYTVTASAKTALRQSRAALLRLWEGLAER
jgi:DNA-binding PadR family transcriptional regulator